MVLKNFNVKITKKILPFKKTIKVDSDKSLSIRSIIIGSISQGVSLVRNILESDDVRDTISVCRKLGVKISKIKKEVIKFLEMALDLIQLKNAKLYLETRTASRLLLGVLSTNPNIEVNISGDNSLNKRSMKNLINILSNFGASFLPKKNKFSFKTCFIKHARWN